ncbi:aminotransferase class III-fold pyridoxal phosphate-dependent enzyme [Leekyejoonella antrihumi]|uniref:Aminotransferase class III-fold pyridoxal phosphate-dependent enzyme n=1 Tax=Leekyejoonella antrihumi TaxID=1660198 RepID=A0A563E9V5_9MICO|nr:aminotransferase class III-fold pyridoxal phosphate-dependent enzyme [Leekyejoonella antrihumi]TWP38574.1 aminotransferase class III-fold pyridoxal phosphate-dependent enzyme [Leekyejoonella antrihumi]
MSTVDDLLARRARHLPQAMSLHYDRPLHIVRGDGAYLIAADGTRYLDCINNVSHVGHANAHVAEAACRQMRMLNTNARFLYAELFDYVERLTDRLPAALSVCFLVNSGSEANELALRIARARTHRRGTVVLDGAYHGNTTSLIDISPYKFNGRGGEGCPPHVQVAATPDPYDGRFRGESSGSDYAQDVTKALERSTQAGHPAGTFITESLLGCAGQVDPPDGYLAAAYAAARAAGAVCIADEVQIGFGRMGDTFWGFETQGVVPDIVTLGKPIGNGHPLGAVVTTPEIAESFATGMEYFNTFGGNPVSCVIGSAVLDVIDSEGLQEHARRVGEHLEHGFADLAKRHQAIGDTRGRGLFRGVALVTDRQTHAPATSLARTLVQQLREEEQILLSLEGPGDNVLKLKPPMPFSEGDADRLLDALDRLLTDQGE